MSGVGHLDCVEFECAVGIASVVQDSNGVEVSCLSVGDEGRVLYGVLNESHRIYDLELSAEATSRTCYLGNRRFADTDRMTIYSVKSRRRPEPYCVQIKARAANKNRPQEVLRTSARLKHKDKQKDKELQNLIAIPCPNSSMEKNANRKNEDSGVAPAPAPVASEANENKVGDVETGKFVNGFALLIGVGADLPMTVTDATALHDLLTDPRRAAYPTEQVKLLTETKADRKSILSAMDNLVAESNANPNAVVVIYYSGHGGRIEKQNGNHEYFLVPHGFNSSARKDTALSGEEFTEKIQAINSRRLLLILDCCHAGGIPALKNIGEKFVKSPPPADLLNTLDAGDGRVILASSSENEFSQAATPYSIFTACLLEALSGKGSSASDGYAKLLEVLIYLFEQVPPRTGDTQHPFVNRISNLSRNFPICYYAGGERQKAAPPVGSTSSSNYATGNLEDNVSGLEREGMQNELITRLEKVKKMREQLAIEANFNQQFQLEKELLRELNAVEKLKAELKGHV